MGIKFRCPNGHKLNVKSFLAGKKGICPHCGTKVIIPEEAQREEAAAMVARNAAEIGGSTAVAVAPVRGLADTVAFKAGPIEPFVPKASPVAEIAKPVAQPVAAVKPVAPVAMAQPLNVAALPATPVVSQAVAAIPMGIAPGVPVTAPLTAASLPQPTIDCIAEAPNAVWYVRPQSGGQFGPARGDIMRKWLGEGRVSADSLVWRDGWVDWKSAATIFPQLAVAAGVMSGSPASASAPLTSSPTNTATISSPSRTVRPRRKSNSFAVLMVVSLGVISVILLGLLLVVVLNGGLGGGS